MTIVDIAGSSSFTVFMTDYDTYAGIFTCQKLTFANRQSATILSRTRSLDKMYVDKVVSIKNILNNKVNEINFIQIRSRLANSQIDPFELSIINQKDCPRDLQQGYNFNIDDETISAKSAAEVFRKAGEKIGKTSIINWALNFIRKKCVLNLTGDGVEYIAGKTKEVYNKVADKADDATVEARTNIPAAVKKLEPEAEWLP